MSISDANYNTILAIIGFACLFFGAVLFILPLPQDIGQFFLWVGVGLMLLAIFQELRLREKSTFKA